GLPMAGGWGVLLLIAAAWGVLIGGFTLGVHRLSGRSVELACVGAPFLWVTFEFICAHLPEISFSLNLLGYPASANLGLLQITTITGIYGLSFLVVGINALLAWAVASQQVGLKRRMTLAGAVAAILLLVMLVGPRVVPEAQAHHFARAVQVNFPEVPEYPTDWFNKNAAQLEEIEKISVAPSAEKPDLLVWPEAPAPFSLIHRVVANISDEVGGFHKGNRYAVGRLPGGNTFGVFICYEAIYPGEVRRFAANGAQLLLNISNDGWFGRSAAAEQHLHMVRVRAVENRRWSVRATNNGYTVSVDPYGRIIGPLLPDMRAAPDLPSYIRTDEPFCA